MAQFVNDPQTLYQVLGDAGMKSPSDRLRIIAAVRRNPVGWSRESDHLNRNSIGTTDEFETHDQNSVRAEEAGIASSTVAKISTTLHKKKEDESNDTGFEMCDVHSSEGIIRASDNPMAF